MLCAVEERGVRLQAVLAYRAGKGSWGKVLEGEMGLEVREQEWVRGRGRGTGQQ